MYAKAKWAFEYLFVLKPLIFFFITLSYFIILLFNLLQISAATRIFALELIFVSFFVYSFSLLPKDGLTDVIRTLINTTSF